MVPHLAAKRMAKERQELEKASCQEKDQDYFVVFEDDNILKFDAYVIAPDTIYRYRLVKLHFEIPNDYPLKPPKVKLIQHTGGRVHPNLYVEGKVCLSILGTWKGEPWAFGMTCHTVLITIRSLLDDEPYKHEPHKVNNPEYNRFVEYTTWKSLLLDYLARETNPAAKAWLDTYVQKNGQAILRELSKQQKAAATNEQNSVKSPYNLKQVIRVDYPALINDLKAAISAAAVRQGPTPGNTSSQLPPSLHHEGSQKRKATNHQDGTKDGAYVIEDEDEADRKRVKPCAAVKSQSTPDIIDLT